MLSSPLDLEILLDRFLSASTPTDCLESLEQLQQQCRRKPRSKSPQDTRQLSAEEAAAKKLEEESEEERQSLAVDALLSNTSALHALCNLVAQSVLPSSIDDSDEKGMGVEGGAIAACELLLAVLPAPPALPNASGQGVKARTGSHHGTTTAELKKQREQKRRVEFISKSLLHYHETIDSDGTAGNKTRPYSALIPSLLDCLCASHASPTIDPPSTYARVLSLQILESLLSATPGALREQLMKAPDGINRLVVLLGYDANSLSSNGFGNVPEEVRNQALLFLSSLASSSSMLARLITFSEGYDRALKIALESQDGSDGSAGGGLTGGSAIVMDCLHLCLALASADDVARELFLGGGDGKGNLDRLAQLIDLRGGERFRFPERNTRMAEEEERKRRTKAKEWRKRKGSGKLDAKEEKGKSGKRSGKQKDDDLDDILRGADISTKDNSAAKESKTPAEPEGPPTPFLTPNETTLVDSVFNLLLLLLHDGDYSSATSKQEEQYRPPTEASRAKRRTRAKTIVSHSLLTQSIVDCALYTLPPPGVDYVSAVPPSSLQQKAMVTMAVMGSMGDTVGAGEYESIKSGENANDATKRRNEEEETTRTQTKLLFETMPLYLRGRVTAMDRLMYLTCTGAYRPDGRSTDDDDYYEGDETAEATASLLSINALSTLRSCLPSETASRMVLHALAPPPPDEADELGAPIELPVVLRLLTTLAENLRFLQSQQHHFQQQDGANANMTHLYRATIGASGSAGALGIFLTKGEGDATREMLLRLPPPPPQSSGPDDYSGGSQAEGSNLIDFVLQHVATYDPNAIADAFSDGSRQPLRKYNASTAYVTVSLLRLLSEWVVGMPKAVLEVLSSPSSVTVGVLVKSFQKKAGGQKHEKQEVISLPSAAEAVPAMSGLLLGLCLEYMADTNTAPNSKPETTMPDMQNAAWTRDTIMNMIQSMGVGKYLNILDEWKKRPLPLPYCSVNRGSTMERRAFSLWYGHSVTLVRRRIVLTLAASGENESESDADETGEGKLSVRSLRKMVSSQADEIDNLRKKLEEAHSTITVQASHIKELKRVAELGTSAEMNDMMSEFADKVTELEKEKEELIEEARNQSELQKKATATKDEEIASLQEDLRKSQEAAEEIEREKETLAEEMAGLSAAYNSLEQEYHNKNSRLHSTVSSEMTAGGETAEEDGGTSSHSFSAPGGETAAEDPGRSENHNQQLQLLRDENARLHEDVRAANEWMAMAVSKMEDMGAENVSLSRSLEEARSQVGSASGAIDDARSTEMDALRSEIQRIEQEAEAAKVAAEAEISLKDDEISKANAIAKKLEISLEEAKQSSSQNESSMNAKLDELQQKSSLQETELVGLRQANDDAQAWMASAVSHVDSLSREIEDLKQKNEELTHAAETKGSSESDQEVSTLEEAVADITSERDDLRASLALVKEQMQSLCNENDELRKKTEEVESNQPTGSNDLQVELDQVRAMNASLASENSELSLTVENLNCKLNEFQSWSEAAQSKLAEIEGKLLKTEEERDDLKSRLDDNLTKINDALLGDEQITKLKGHLVDKDEEVDRLRTQINSAQSDLINKTGEMENVIEVIRTELATEKQKYEELGKKEADNATILATISTENEKLMSVISQKQSELDSMKLAKDELKATIEESQLRIAELEAAKSASEAQVDQLMELDNHDDELISITAERNQLRTQLEDLSEDYEHVKKSLERTDVENGNLLARNRALEQDNKSLEYQHAEALQKFSNLERLEGEVVEKNRLLKNASEDLAALQSAFDEMKTNSEETVHLWQERTDTLESTINELESQLEQQDKEAMDTIAEWEARCLALEGQGEEITAQWQKQTDSLEADVAKLENQIEQNEKETHLITTQWESRCAVLEDSLKTVNLEAMALTQKNEELEKSIALMSDQMNEAQSSRDNEMQQLLAEREQWSTNQTKWVGLKDELEKRLNERDKAIEHMHIQIDEKDEIIANSDDQIELLTKELLETRDQSEQVVSQWQERVEQLEANINELEEALVEQQNSANDAIAQWEARCSTLNDKIEELEVINQDPTLIHKLEENLSATKLMLDEKQGELNRAISELGLARSEARKSQSQISHLEASLESALSQLEDTRIKLDRSNAEHGLLQQTLLHKENEFIHQKKALMKEKEAGRATLEEKLSDLTTKLDEKRLEGESSQTKLNEIKGLLNLRIEELEQEKHTHELLRNQLSLERKEHAERNASLLSRLDQLETNRLELEKKLEESKLLFSDSEKSLKGNHQDLMEKLSVLEFEKSRLEQEKNQAIQECEESKVVVFELQEELRCSKDELQSFVTDQFSAKATEMATQALRQQMVEIRSQYAADQKLLIFERETRIAVEEEVKKLKADLALLSQATEYDENVDVHVRKVAKRMAAENSRKERKEMEELRSALERLKEELGSSRWKERDAEENAANARLQASILEQEVVAVKSDLALMEQAMEELENSKIEMSVSLEYRIEALENDRDSAATSHKEELSGIKAELARINQEKYRLAHSLEQSEKANAALVFSTSNDGIDGEEKESDVVKLRLERAQLLAKITEMGADMERRVREAVAAHASYADADLILEKELRKSVESSLSDALTKLEETRAVLKEETAKVKNEVESPDEHYFKKLKETIEQVQSANTELEEENKSLQAQLGELSDENAGIVSDLKEKLRCTEERVRAVEREKRFESALASEIAHLRSSGPSSEKPFKTSQALIVHGIDHHVGPKLAVDEESKEPIDRNSIYIIEMYDYVVELKNSINEERQMYRELLAEHEDLLALLGQVGLDGAQYGSLNACE